VLLKLSSHAGGESKVIYLSKRQALGNHERGCRFNDFLKAPSWTLEFKQCTLEKKSISGNFKLCCAANAFLGQRHRRPSGLDVLGRGRSKNGEAKGGGMNVLKG